MSERKDYGVYSPEVERDLSENYTSSSMRGVDMTAVPPSDPIARLREMAEMGKDNSEWPISGRFARELGGIADALARLQQELDEPMMCEFCQKEDGDPSCFLEVCPECWNRANAGTGWMQRALKAEARIVELEQALDGVRLQLIAAGTQLLRGQDL